MSLIGESPPRPDGFAKVSGAARYADDHEIAGTFFGATVRSPHPLAAIESIRFRREDAPEGSICVTADDLEGPNAVHLIADDWPILARGETRHVGEPVALVAAPSRVAARRAAAAVDVEYRAGTPVLSLEEAAGTAPFTARDLARGDVDAAFETAEIVVEGVYSCGHQEHIYIECQAMTAWCEDDGGLAVAGSMQCPYYVHKSLQHHFGLPEEMVRVRATTVGGGFGGKEDFPSMIALHAAVLAKAAVRPVRLVYDRHEDIIGTTKRHPAIIRHRSAVDSEGRLQALDIDVTMDGGAYSTLSSVVLSRAVLHATGPYRCDNVRVSGRVLKTNTATNGAFRGFGAPQVEFAMERQMDAIGRRLGLDPLEIRLRNALEAGDVLHTGQVMDETTSARACLEKAAEMTDFRRRWSENEALRAHGTNSTNGRPMPGIGLALFFHGAGFTGSGERRMRSPVKARIREDGRLEILTAMIDMGQGCVAIFPQMACEATGLAEDDVTFAEPDTREVPDSGPTVASRTTMIVGGTIMRTAAELRDRVLDWWKTKEGVNGEVSVEDGLIMTAAVEAGVPDDTVDTVDAADGEPVTFREVARAFHAAGEPVEHTVRHRPPDWQEFDDDTYQGAAYPTYAWGCDVVDVEVDPDTFAVRPRRITAVCEIGKAIHPTLCKGQIEGGTLQAVAWGLMEEIKLDNGRYLNDRLATYIIPTFKDTPPIDVHLLERPWSDGPFGAKGVGELPMDGGAPAAASAIENATGAAANEIPATPERILGWLRKADG